MRTFCQQHSLPDECRDVACHVWGNVPAVPATPQQSDVARHVPTLARYWDGGNK
ncbi:MAG: hypothetical protein HDR84_07580 [Bacteroides sp.]|nr:hypothetical protein [Bacteroides sp.]